MYEIKVKSGFSAAHNLRNYRGKCENLHGHNWNIEAIFAYKLLSKAGMAVDFKEAKSILKEALEKFDHAYLNELEFFKKINPTSENIAKFIYDHIKKKNKHISVVSVWENDMSCASYSAVVAKQSKDI
ncbi:MAG: 6-carboxytetrahydropterin synthase QueD [Candidatus Omnitrophota bacterium]|nr:6-carboxytetrahydropterin synthase QueD [Candidatus Omnitrophota bacterium]